jgi:protein TonB
MNSHSRQDALLVAFAVLSLLLHLALLHLLPADRLMTAPARKEPVYVEVRSPQPQVRPRELDVPPDVRPRPPRQKPAKRLAPVDHVAPKETAPKGDAADDRRPSAPAVASPAPGASSARPSDAGRIDPDALDLGLPQVTRDRYHGEWRNKSRPDVAEGDAVWLDTEKDLLASFFQRFRNNIYQVWNYPRPAAERGESGTCLLKIVINRDGSVEEVKPIESSGHPTLDREAVAAVYRGATYGDLPRNYPKEKLTILAYFQYRLSSGAAGFSGRAGDIFGR